MPVFVGSPGNDVLPGSSGADSLIGLAGDDIYIVDDPGDEVIEAENEGADTVYSYVSYVLTAGSHVETLSVTDHNLTTEINLFGNEFANNIYGNAGANILDGGGGADAMIGFGGNDIFVVDNAADIAFEFSNQGFDTVYVTTSYMLNGGSEIEVLSAQDNSSTYALNLTGNEYANIIYGNNAANILNGLAGADAMIGFGGNDIFIVDNAADVAFEFASQGSDTVYTSTSYMLNGGSEIEVLSASDNGATVTINLTGNEYANTLYGNNGTNILDGQGGNDIMLGFGGDDIFIVDAAGDQVFEDAGAGNDTVYTFVSYALTAGSQVETLSVTDNGLTGAIDLTGNEFANNIYGNNGNNLLNGGGGNDTLLGFNGSDWLNGGLGADTLVGGAGNDRFVFNTTLGGGNIDTLSDFAPALDKIVLDGTAGSPFSALAAGPIAFSAFIVGTTALDANDYLIYNSATGALLYDADANGADVAVQFATIAPGLVGLNSDMFEISGATNSAPAILSGAAVSIAENTAASTVIYQTVATDADGDRITYALTGADASLLTIDANGAVRLISPADFETKASYSFNVVAADSGSSTSKAITLTITDVLDASTPIINETAAANDTAGEAQVIDRNIFTIASNPNLHNPALPSATIVGAISSDTDRDYFSITLQAGEQLILDVDGTLNGANPSASLDSFLRLFGPTQVQIGQNDDQQGFDQGSVPTIASHNTDSQIIFRAATSGTYYFSIESFEQLSAGNYQINVSIGPSATPQQLIAEDVDALISGAEWNDNDLTFGFPTLATQYPSSFPEVNPAGDFQPFSAGQQAATRQLIQLVANVSSLTFTELTGGSGTGSGAGSADLRYAMSTDSEVEVAYAYYPSNGGPSSPGGSAWFNTEDFNQPVRGNYDWMGILHETGHALGLKHGHEFPLAISADRDSTEYSVMTYRSYPGDNIADGYSNGEFSYPQTLMMYDIAALQEMYGANYGFNAGNSVYTWLPGVGETSINGVGQGAVGDGSSPGSNRIFLTIWDGGGTDTYNLSAYSTATTIDLRPGEWTTTSAAQLANLGDGHSARGNIANALMFGDSTASLIENAVGGSAGDTIIANQVANSLTGNGGADIFTWKAGTDAGTGAAADTIADFLRGTDKIDLSAIDANPGTGANDAFTFINTGAFTNVAGQLRYQVEGANLRVQADLDGNGVADMEIIVTGHTIFAGTDFIL